MAQTLCRLGANVFICGRTAEKLETALTSIGPSGCAHAVTCDVRDYEAVGRMVSELTALHGGIDCLVNNAAGNFLCPSADLSPNAFKTVVDIVLVGAFNCTQHFANALRSRKAAGSILNIVTTYTDVGSSFVLPSACAKAGVHAMTTSLAYEWAAYGIRVNAIAPGPFYTEGAWSRLVPTEELENAWKQSVPTGRFADVQEVANLSAFLLSDTCPSINGECVAIDGGQHLGAGLFNFMTTKVERGELKSLMAAMKKKEIA
jgi:NAD(P)-dependent dehydrogenase (short-subunit alcohol dehydrogenase family)